MLRQNGRVRAAAGDRRVSMGRRLFLYWFSMVLAVLALVILILSLTGVLSVPAQKLREALDLQQQNTCSALSGHLDALTAQCIVLSDQIGQELDSTLTVHGRTVSQLNNDPDGLLALQSAVYAPLSTTLRTCACSGAFFVVDATTNTRAETAAVSRSGMYLRFANLNATGTADQSVVYFRGIPDIARREQLQMHNRWNLEFDVSCLPGFAELLKSPVTRLADACLWTDRVHLKDTWEDALLLCMPVLNSRGDVCGVCGAEISDLYFRLSYPSIESPYGSMVTVLAPLDGDTLLLSRGMLGSLDGTYLESSGTLTVQEGRYFNTYTSPAGSYVGMQRKIAMRSVSGLPMAVATLIPEESYDAVCGQARTVWIAASLGFLLLMLGLTLYLSRRFVRPIARSLEALRAEAPLDGRLSGISEVDELLAIIQAQSKSAPAGKNGLPPDVDELLRAFADRAAGLTSAERNILKYYIDGHDAAEIPALAYISASTVKKHNSNIYRKLEVASREELMLYIELFRRCGRLDELLREPPRQNP